MALGRTTARLFVVSVLCVLILSIASSSDATSIPVRTGSGYGPSSSSPSAFSDCLSSTGACEAFQNTGELININGTNYDLFQLTSGNGNILNVFDFGAIQAGTLINLPFQNWGVLGCGNSNIIPGATSSAFDSGQNFSNLTGLPCTPIDGKAQGIPLLGGTILFSTVDAFGNNVAFTVNADGSIRFDSSFTDVALFTTDSVVATPEPGSLMLLGTGIVALVGLRRRRQ